MQMTAHSLVEDIFPDALFRFFNESKLICGAETFCGPVHIIARFQSVENVAHCYDPLPLVTNLSKAFCFV